MLVRKYKLYELFFVTMYYMRLFNLEHSNAIHGHNIYFAVPATKILSSFRYIIFHFQAEVHSLSVLNNHFYGRRRGHSVKSVLWKGLFSFEKFSLCSGDKTIVSFCMNVPLRAKDR
jgi:hypothetical protein